MAPASYQTWDGPLVDAETPSICYACAPMSRTFTLDEATALLPRLREILAEMQEKKPQVDAIREEIVAMTKTASGNGHLVSQDVRDRQKAAQELIERLNQLGAELRELGCESKGIDEGLVDFPAEREGHTIYLCWKLGEDAITHWHELDSGFGGRQPL